MGNGRVGRADGNETDGMCSPVNWNGGGWRGVEDVNLPGFFSKRTGDEGEKCSHLAFCLPLFLRKGVWGMIDTQYYGSMNKRRFPEDLFGAIAITRHAF
jgi:hypothetical protein